MVTRCPQNVAALVRDLDRGVQMVMVVVAEDGFVVLILCLEEQRPRGKRFLRVRPVLGGDFRVLVCRDGFVCVQGEGLGRLRNQTVIGIQVVGAYCLCQRVTRAVPVLFFPDPAVKRVI